MSFFLKAEKKFLKTVRRLCHGHNLPKKDIALISGNELNDYTAVRRNFTKT